MGELITCSKAVKIIDECVFNPKTGTGRGGGGGCRKGERETERKGGRVWWLGRGGGRRERC